MTRAWLNWRRFGNNEAIFFLYGRPQSVPLLLPSSFYSNLVNIDRLWIEPGSYSYMPCSRTPKTQVSTLTIIVMIIIIIIVLLFFDCWPHKIFGINNFIHHLPEPMTILIFRILPQGEEWAVNPAKSLSLNEYYFKSLFWKYVSSFW